MGTDHKGRRIGDNHRPTPRLAQLLLNARGANMGGTVQSVQNDIDDYRDYRGMHNVPEYEQMIDEDQEYLNDTFKMRHQK
jgi:hypothetical protein